MLLPLFKFVSSEKTEPKQKKSIKPKSAPSAKAEETEEYPSRDKLYIDPSQIK
ncbi:hypothetical protein EDD80_101618 [Anseongella ginsenosidimutans]|uniref:Uncharacterized protein n=1 Tax=Anseongella ginsenosidimutans TaxID=496056 RepID=A0A4R3KY41_9SPHI|nr:hypothetical protein [Anseongella ginsenosidimutans]TCS90418.1 hypothetical protein EDD80_101618 [Anseongella ginsenosidimutans]